MLGRDIYRIEFIFFPHEDIVLIKLKAELDT